MPRRTLLVANKPQPSARFHRRVCMAGTCRRASTFGRLCDEHSALVLRDAAKHLGEVGLVPTRVSANAGGYVYAELTDGRRELVHRAVLEGTLGRPLLPGENVHHINGVRCDNRVGNLELWVTRQPVGQRPEDLAAWARDILSRYGTVDERQRYA